MAAVFRYNNAGQPRRWILDRPVNGLSTNIVNPTTGAIRYFLASDAYSGGNRIAELNAIRASFAQWQSVPGTRLRFEEGGLLDPPVDVNINDRTNVIFWAKQTTLVNGGRDDISGTLGYSFYRLANDLTLLEVDIVLNGAQYDWYTDFNDTNSPSRFIEGVVLHEIGHLIGLDHSPLGASTMMVRGLAGINPQAGLSPDEISAVQYLYPQAPGSNLFANLQGTVVRQGTATGVAGAVVCLEDTAGNTFAATVTQANGTYMLPALPSGVHQARVTPLDPAFASSTLLQPRDITVDGTFKATTDFQPTTNVPVTLVAGVTETLNFGLASGNPAFRITRIRPPTSDPFYQRVINAPAVISPGTQDVILGVYGPDLPNSGAVLSISGDGLWIGPTQFTSSAFPDLHLISITVSVATNATPGFRSFYLRQGTNLAVANGFLEIAPAVPDFDLDGLDDRFQRRFFPLFTAGEAEPTADPDGDGLNNQAEYWAGTNPLNAQSRLRIDRIIRADQGVWLEWRSEPGKRFRAWRQSGVMAPWESIAPSIDATNQQVLTFLPGNSGSAGFYRIEAIP
jgi:hypothetical protein